jgi:prophage regulatory protein
MQNALSSVAGEMPKVGFLRLPQVLAIFPVSRSAWWAGIKCGKYPQGVKLSARCTAWRAADIVDLVARISNAAGQDAAGGAVRAHADLAARETATQS